MNTAAVILALVTFTDTGLSATPLLETEGMQECLIAKKQLAPLRHHAGNVAVLCVPADKWTAHRQAPPQRVH